MISGASAMIQCLNEEGVPVIFGYPGVAIAPFYEALSTVETPKHILVRQEQNAGHMASGYARVTGKVGVCAVTSGPGATNLITGIATAYMDSIPMVAITGQVQSNLLGRDVFQEVDITGAVSPFIKHSYLIKNAADIPRVFKEAFYIARTGRPGPVLIDIPIDMQTQMINFSYPKEVSLRSYKPSVEGNMKQIIKVSEAISQAERPLICFGGGIFNAGAAEVACRLCEEANIPAVSTMMGLGVLPTAHPLSIGMIGAFGHDAANQALNQADLLIIAGARVGDRAFTTPSKVERKTKTIHIDVDPAEIGKNVSATVPLVGDLKVVLGRLVEQKPFSHCGDWISELQEAAKTERAMQESSGQENSICPRNLLQALNEAVDKDAIVVSDVGQHQIWTAKNIAIREGRFLTTGGLGTMGYSLPAALGVKTALPDRQALVICGDGGFQMMFNELSTLVECGYDLKIILLNNRTLGMVYEYQTNIGYNHFGVAMPEVPDFQQLAKAFGIKSNRVSEGPALVNALKEMLEHKGPYLLECLVASCERTRPIPKEA